VLPQTRDDNLSPARFDQKLVRWAQPLRSESQPKERPNDAVYQTNHSRPKPAAVAAVAAPIATARSTNTDVDCESGWLWWYA
jgi:hypothetical protein